MDDRWFSLVQIFESRDSLTDYGLGFSFWNDFVLFEKEVQIVTLTVLKDSAEPKNEGKN